VLAVVLTGPPGAGKSSVLTALADALSDDDIRHAAIEVESLVWAHPALSDEQWSAHLAAVCRLYRQAGHTLLLLAQTLESDDDTAQLRAAVGADEIFLVRLDAPAVVLASRITEREPPSWSGLPGLIAHARELAETTVSLSGVDLVLGTEGVSAEQVASRIRAAGPPALRSG
jgi:predicted kinase